MDAPRSDSPLVWVRPVALAVAFVAAGIAIDVLMIRTTSGQQLDDSTFGAVVDVQQAFGAWSGRLRTLLPAASAGLLLVAIVVTLARRRWRDVIPAVVLPLLTLGLSTALKDVLERPALGAGGGQGNTFPSGHTAVTIACLIAFLWLIPRRRATVAIPLFLLATGAGAFQVISYAHRLSDVLGGALLAGAIAACFLQRAGGLQPLGRGVLVGVIVIAAATGVWQLASWQSTGVRGAGVVAVFLLSGAAATAAITVGAERAPSVPPAQPTEEGVGNGERGEARRPHEISDR